MARVYIDGTDITSFIEEDGLKWQRNDLDGPNAGRSMSGLMIRDRVAIKQTLTINCRALTGAEVATILSLIEPEWVSVRYTDPTTNSEVTKMMYSNNVPVTLKLSTGGVDYYSGLSFPLIER